MRQTMARRGARSAKRVASVFWALVLACALAPAIAAAPPDKGALRLESLQIEIWPEYDRPAALVILRGEIAADVRLPAAVSLRIPATSGGPAAVAYATEKKGRLLNLKHDRSEAGEFIVLRFTVPERFFHVEFYDRLATDKSVRSYRYFWPGDLAVNWLDVVVQEPAGASGMSILPALEGKAAGSDGLQYRSAQLGPAQQGTPLPIEIQYTKTDPRTSVEILKLSAAAPSAGEIKPAASKELAPLYFAMGGVALLAVAAAVVYALWLRRRRPASLAERAGYCAKCRNEVVAGDRFCSKCGAALK